MKTYIAISKISGKPRGWTESKSKPKQDSLLNVPAYINEATETPIRWVTPRQLYAHPKNWLKEFKALQPNIL